MKPIELRLKEANHATRHDRSRRSPPHPATPLPIDQLWNLITDDQRQRTLVTLSRVLLRQLDGARDEKEVPDEGA